MTRVLPDPAPARTSNGPSPCVTASRCRGLSDVTSIIGFGDRIVRASDVELLKFSTLTDGTGDDEIQQRNPIGNVSFPVDVLAREVKNPLNSRFGPVRNLEDSCLVLDSRNCS